MLYSAPPGCRQTALCPACTQSKATQQEVELDTRILPTQHVKLELQQTPLLEGTIQSNIEYARMYWAIIYHSILLTLREGSSTASAVADKSG